MTSNTTKHIAMYDQLINHDILLDILLMKSGQLTFLIDMCCQCVTNYHKFLIVSFAKLMCMTNHNKAFYFNGNQTFQTWVRQLHLEEENNQKKKRKTNFTKMCHNGTRALAHATRREGRKAWMGWTGGNDVVCEGDDDNMCAFLHCLTGDLAL